METPGKNKVLVVDDSQAITGAVSEYITALVDVEVVCTHDLAQTREQLERNGDQFFVAVADLALPDAPNGEVADFLVDQGIPVIVLTGNMSDSLRDQMMARDIIDYVVKRNLGEVEYVAQLVRRIYRNRDIKVLVVDDSRSLRGYLENLLRMQCFQTLGAANGEEALAMLNDYPDIGLVIVDYNMPIMDGADLITCIRESFSRGELPIIGLSTHATGPISAKLLKAGANDFIARPFLNEEFLCRVTQTIELVENLRAMREAASHDFLTDLYNRRYFFEFADKLLRNAKRSQTPVGAAMLDIDHFKRINDRYGHATGDLVIRRIAQVLKDELRDADVIARFGGEEFCVIGTQLDNDTAQNLFERLRRKIADTRLSYEGEDIQVTVSIGVCVDTQASLDDMIRKADAALYCSKESGRNRLTLA